MVNTAIIYTNQYLNKTQKLNKTLYKHNGSGGQLFFSENSSLSAPIQRSDRSIRLQWSQHRYSQRLTASLLPPVAMQEVIGLASKHAKTKKQRERTTAAGDICSSCSSDKVYIDGTRGEVICSECGLVLSDRSIDMGPEWRAFTADEQNARQRVGGPADWSKFDQGLTTVIGRQNVDAAGRKLTSTRRAQIHRLRKWQIRTKVHSSDKRNLAVAMTELHRISSQLSIPYSIRESSAVIYRKALRKRLTRGRTILGMIAASLYLACRVHQVPRPLEEIVEQIHITRKELSLCVRLILRYLNLKVPFSSPIDFIHRFGTELGIPGEAKKKAIDILQLAKKERLTIGKDPKGMAAAAIYVASILTGHRRTQLEIARTARVTEVTVRNRYKETCGSLRITIPMVAKLGISTG